jgi:hypothetical protein
MASPVLSPEERALLPTPAQVAEYDEHGWWISPPCLGEDALEELRFGVERYYAGERDWRLPIVSASDWTAADGDVIRQNDFASLQPEEFRAFLRRPLVPVESVDKRGVGQLTRVRTDRDIEILPIARAIITTPAGQGRHIRWAH